MFGINKKAYHICALIFGMIGIVVLGLKVFKILSDEVTYTLISLIFLMLGFVLYIRPSIKLMNIKMELCQKYRNDLYNELTKDNKYETNIKFYENESGEIQYKEFKFSGLTFEEAQVILIMLLNDYVKIVFGIMDEKKRRFTGASVKEFIIEIEKKNKEKLYKDFVRENKFVK